MKKYLVQFVVTDHLGKFPDETCLEDVFAESEEEAVELVRQWLIDTSVLDGYNVDFEEVSYVDGVHIVGGKYDSYADQEYSLFRVIETLSHETNTKKRGIGND